MTTTTKKASDKKDPKKASKRPLGKTTGVDQRATWRLMLAKGFKEKLTDEQILAAMRKEFPDNKVLSNASVAVVSRVRSEFNRGVHEPDKKPLTVQMHAWDKDGKNPSDQKKETKASKATAKSRTRKSG
jgi:hypothetical protein